MEAASARYAARDRWGGDMGPQQAAPSQLQRFIQAACSPENFEPNLALNLEIADLINSKKGSAPREAAVAMVNYVNHRNPNVAMLALHLLDICVKNCGYPFHLQISTKEFLNELVRRFPERPPLRPSRVQLKILEAIEEWRSTICQTSRYKDDLGFIRDMHRLLSYKGYTFPEVRRDDAAVLNPSDNLKSAEEMEEEEREAQSAKLQELIRRGAPEDLQEANRLMKIMAGYDTRSKVDYRAKAAEDVAKIQQKARLLEERLEAFQPGDVMTDGDVFSELAAALQSAHPKIQKMCEEESDDHEAVARLLDINDSIHRTVERYKLMRNGDVEAANKIAKGTHGTLATDTDAATAGSKKTSAAAELSLIDLDDHDTNGTGSAARGGPTSSSSLENDLLGLSVADASTYGQTGGIALGFGANTNIPGPALLSSITEHNSARGQISSSTPSAHGSPFIPIAAGPSLSASASQSGTPLPPASLQSAFPAPSKATASDPFASLNLASSAFSARGNMTSSALSQPPAAPPAAADEDEWSFSSALPPETPAQPQEHRARISNTGLVIDMAATRSSSTTPAMSLLFTFSNNTAQPISELHFQLAVTKGFELRLNPQSGRSLEPKQSRGVSQAMEVWHAGDRNKRVESIKMRWRVSYKAGAEPRNEMGEIPEFSLA